MTAKEAYKAITEKFTMWNLISCREYDTVFVFQFIPKSYVKTKATNKLLNSAISINKETGIIKPFRPMDMPISEFRAGKEVKDFK